MQRRTAFTLIELLVVISIMSLLTMLVMPSMYRVKELTRRSICSSNLKAIHNAVFIFAGNRPSSENRPIPTVGEGSAQLTTFGLAPTGTTTLKYSSISSAWYAMAGETNLSLNSFGCPSDAGLQPGAGQYDFAALPTGNPISYSFQVSWKGHRTFNMSDNGALALIADNNGLLSWSPAGSFTRNSSVKFDKANPAAMNSANHSGEGQVVCYLGGQVYWRPTPMCGIDDDNIYVPGGKDNPSDAGLTSASPSSDTDSFLLP